MSFKTFNIEYIYLYVIIGVLFVERILESVRSRVDLPVGEGHRGGEPIAAGGLSQQVRAIHWMLCGAENWIFHPNEAVLFN